jgi:WD40 repeat protein
LWDLKSQAEAAAFAGHSQVVSCLGVADDDRSVYSGSYDRTVRCWDVEVKYTQSSRLERERGGRCKRVLSGEERSGR